MAPFMLPPMLLADWIEGLAPLLLVIFWLVRTFLEAKGEQSKKKAQPAAKDLELERNPDIEPAMAIDSADPFKATLAAGAAAKPEPVEAPSAGDGVQDFLRRLEEQEQQQRAKQRKKQRRPKKRAVSAEGEAPRRGGRASQSAAGESVDEHVRSHITGLKEPQLAEQAAHMGERVATSDDRMAARLHQKFDHKLGNIERREVSSPAEEEASPTPAESIAEMLRSPEGVRNAVLLNEILTRPTDRL